jgi:hypothetical protein
VDERLWKRHVAYLERFLRNPTYASEADRLGIAAKLEQARGQLTGVREPGYLESLRGLIGAEPAVPAPVEPAL